MSEIFAETKKRQKRRVYLDHAAATPLDERVKQAMEHYFSDAFGNPSALYHDGRTVKEAIGNARASIAKILGSKPEEIIFTSSGTESNALALLGVMRKNLVRNSEGALQKGHLITSAFEHHAILNNSEKLKREGFTISSVGIDSDGFIKMDELKDAIRPDTVLISIMYANNEIGTIQDISAIGAFIKEIRRTRVQEGNKTPLWLHTDACQAAGYLDLSVEKLGVDLMTVNGSKIYGPKGTAFLFVRKGVQLESLWDGGGQEGRLRSGTENTAGIVGLAHALEIAAGERVQESIRLEGLRNYGMSEITKRIPKVVVNGALLKRLPNNINVSILDIEGEAMLLYLDEYGIEASTGSACDSSTLDPSHVILALGKPYEFAHASMRFTLGRSTTKADIDYLLDILPEVVTILRKISPVTVDINAKELSTASAFAGQGLPHWEKKRGTKLKQKS